ncbi:MAG: cell division topological specificity factor MinE [Thiotrichales bacterium]|jgi:cell division topological specificity factor|nr:cell division topological specificity factor MinE [Pseudomonadota bacterium]MCI4410710.1 cell division topological specificity factor MinE [Thiotrichales bacterium]
MSLLDLFRKKDNSASLAKDRLGVIIAAGRSAQNKPNFLPKMREEIIAVIAKYIPVDPDAVKVLMETHNGVDMLEIDIPLR